MVVIALLGSAGAVLFLVVGLRQLVANAADRRQWEAAASGYETEPEQPLVDQLNRWFRRTRMGRQVERELVLAGVHQRAVVVVLTATGVGLVTAYVLWTALAPVFGLAGIAAGGYGLRAFIRRAKQRRLESFIVQMPELARVLANAAHAGLSIPTAIAIAGEELPAPAGTELESVANALRFGTPLETALDELR